MKNKKEEDTSSHFSSTKTNSSSVNEDSDIFPKLRPRGGIKARANNFQSGRNTVAVPLSSFSGISHNASFQSKLKFFNAGKGTTKPVYHHVPHDKVITEEPEKKDNKIIKNNTFNIEDKNKKAKNEKEDIDKNININNLLNPQTNKNNSNKNNDIEVKKHKTIYHKKNSISFSNQIYSKSIETKTSGTFEKNNEQSPIKLKSLKDQWYFQKILLDYNILDFTSKYKLFYNLYKFSDI